MEVPNVSITVFEYIGVLRRRKGMSQTELAKKAGVSRVYVSRIENGDANVTLDVVDKIAGVLGFSIAFSILEDK